MMDKYIKFHHYKIRNPSWMRQIGLNYGRFFGKEEIFFFVMNFSFDFRGYTHRIGFSIRSKRDQLRVVGKA